MKDKLLLDATHQWPAVYRFKFIVPEDSVPKFLQLLSKQEELSLELRKSENGRYNAYTLPLLCNSSDEVLLIYSRFSEIEALIAL